MKEKWSNINKLFFHIRKQTGQMALQIIMMFKLWELMVQDRNMWHRYTSTHNVVMYLEVLWQQQFTGPEETENVAEYLAVSIYEVVLLQAVQHDGLGAIEQTTDSENWNWHTRAGSHTHTHREKHTHTQSKESASSLQMHETITLHLFFNFISTELEMH